mmetsp:Transcript_16666/g.39894  ORF Transcript_16666/g.39894 Transcript_16666/m.39894 type:complete len:332 (+) Transcript_16666:1890-2885(+)
MVFVLLAALTARSRKRIINRGSGRRSLRIDQLSPRPRLGRIAGTRSPRRVVPLLCASRPTIVDNDVIIVIVVLSIVKVQMCGIYDPIRIPTEEGGCRVAACHRTGLGTVADARGLLFYIPPTVSAQRLHPHSQHPLRLPPHVVQISPVELRGLRLQIVRQRQHLQIHVGELRIIARLPCELRHGRQRLAGGSARPQLGIPEGAQSKLELLEVPSRFGIADLSEDGGDGVVFLGGVEEREGLVGGGGSEGGEGGLFDDRARIDDERVILLMRVVVVVVVVAAVGAGVAVTRVGGGRHPRRRRGVINGGNRRHVGGARDEIISLCQIFVFVDH